MRVFPFPDKIKSRDELKHDILYEKIPKAEIERISDKAWETGVKAACDIYEEYGRQKNIKEIIALSGLGINRVDTDNVVANMRYFSEYYSGKKLIFLYNKSICKWAKSNNLGLNKAEELILAHEYYHYLECTKIGLTSRQYQVPVLKIGSMILLRSGIRALSEIAAHGFAYTFYTLCNKEKYTVILEENENGKDA